MREIIFDTETTGLDPQTGDRLVEIGCIELIDRRESGRIFHSYFCPDRDMPEQAEKVHGLSTRFLSDKPRFAERADELLAFLSDSPMVAHNAEFDFGFVNAELAKEGYASLSYERMICTVQLARKLHPGAKRSLDALCVRYGIDRSHRTKHGALLDAELLAHLYIEMNGGRQIGLGFSGAVSDTATTRSGASHSRARQTVQTDDRPLQQARVHCANQAEKERHDKFIRQLNKPLWLDSP